jgi:hypothetical protein
MENKIFKHFLNANKYQYKTEFARKSPGSYQFLLKNKMLDEACKHMPNRKDRKIILTYEIVKSIALKYSIRSKFSEMDGSAYNKALELGILDEICAHMPINANAGKHADNFKWTDDALLLVAKQYATRTELKMGSSGAYDAMVKSGTIEKYCSHMKLSKNTSSFEKELFEIINNVYPNSRKYYDRKVKINKKHYIKGFQIDIYVDELKKGIEFDGKYYHSFEFMRKDPKKVMWTDDDIKNYHKLKDEWFKSKGIQILHIKEVEWLKDKNKCVKKCFDFLLDNT